MSNAFRDILAGVVEAVPGAEGAIFVDWEGEVVDEVTRAAVRDLRLLGAHWAIAYYQARTAFLNRGLATPDEMVLRFERQQVLVRRVTDEYLVLLALGPQVSSGRALHLLREAGERLKGEM